MDAFCPLEVVRVCGCIPVSLAEIWSGCASTGKEYMLQLDYTPSRNLSVYVRYKYKQRENITPYHQQRLRMQALYTISSSVSLRTSADGICYTEANEKAEGG